MKMKKIMMFIAVAVCAVATQAASIIWDSGTINIGGTKVGKGDVTGSLYLITQAEYNALDLSNAKSVYDTYKAKAASVTGTSAKSGSVQLTTTGAIGDTQYAVIIYETAKTDPAEFVITKGYDTINSLGAQDGIASTGLFAAAGGEGSWAPTTGGGAPEPTSGLLLLVGGAMLALRRKQK